MYLLLGLALGFLINLRLMGVMLFLLVIFFICYDLFINRLDKQLINSKLKLLLVFILATLAMLYISWPFLWPEPVNHFLTAFGNMSKFRWHGDVLYLGEFISAKELPWHYVLVWIGITTPTGYLLAIVFGLIAGTAVLLKNPIRALSGIRTRMQMVLLTCTIAPIIAVVVFQSVLYDGWRHLFFVYPPMVILGALAIDRINRVWVKAVVLGLVGISFLQSGIFMVSNPGVQHVYFNRLLTPGQPEAIRQTFEMDYWGVSYYQGIMYILENDPQEKIKMKFANSSGKFTVKYRLPDALRDRVEITDTDPDYFLTEYRFHPQEYSYPENQRFYDIVVEGNTILSVFKEK